jgi:hypothetical protein
VGVAMETSFFCGRKIIGFAQNVGIFVVLPRQKNRVKTRARAEYLEFDLDSKILMVSFLDSLLKQHMFVDCQLS